MLIFMHESTHQEQLSQRLQTDNKQFKEAVTFLIGYNGIFNVTNKNEKTYFAKTFTDEMVLFIQIKIPPGAYEIGSPKSEIKRIFIGAEHFIESNYSFTIKPNFSNLGSIIEITINFNN